MSSPEPGDRAAAPGALRIVQAFLNSADLEDGRDDFGDTDGLRSWIDAHDLAPASIALTDADPSRAIAFREGLRDRIMAHSDDPVPEGWAARRRGEPDAIPLLFAFGEADEPRLDPGGTGIDAVFGRLAAIIYTASVDGTWERLKICRNDVCRWAFYDASKNRSGVWCSMAVCGARLKARSWRERHRG